MLVPVFSLHHVIETTLGLPCSLVLFFCFLFNLILVYNWECQTEMLSRVSIEFGLILGNLLTELLFLKLPDIQFLVTVLENIDSLWDV